MFFPSLRPVGFSLLDYISQLILLFFQLSQKEVELSSHLPCAFISDPKSSARWLLVRISAEVQRTGSGIVVPLRLRSRSYAVHRIVPPPPLVCPRGVRRRAL